MDRFQGRRRRGCIESGVPNALWSTEISLEVGAAVRVLTVFLVENN